jgi:Fur family transcriptional regulator, peroxide stress response regulator
MNNLEKIQKQLIDHDLKATHQRIVILDAVYKLRSHPTAEEIHQFVHKHNPTISLGTVYNTLDAFVGKGLVNLVRTHSEAARYDGFTDEHYHLINTETFELRDYYDEELSRLIKDFFAKKEIPSFRITGFRLDILGNSVNS